VLAVQALLTVNVGLTIAELAAQAELSRSTISKAASALEKAGAARREPGSRHGTERHPDLWFVIEPSVAPTDTVSPADGADHGQEGFEPGTSTDGDTDQPPLVPGIGETAASETGTDPAEPAPSGAQNPAHEGTQDQPTGNEEGAVGSGQAQHPTAQPAAASDTGAALATTTSIDTVKPTGPGEAGRSDTADTDTPQPESAVSDANSAAATGTGSTSLGKGGLRALIDAHLEAHPDDHFSPSQLGKILGRSSGAISNALDKLVELRRAELTCPKPRRFQHRSA
jgi:DNA-binding MarR family transcriptional regulator